MTWSKKRIAASLAGGILSVGGLVVFASVPMEMSRSNVTMHRSTSSASTSGISSPRIEQLGNPGGRDVYQTVPNEVLFSSPPNEDLTDVRQGADAEDCYFLGTLLAVAQRDPQLLENDITATNKLYTTTYHALENYKLGTYTATVNGDLPNNSHGLADEENGIENINGQNVAWAAIYEKLWAAVNGDNYANIDGTSANENQDHNIQYAINAITNVTPTVRVQNAHLSSVSFRTMVSDYANGIVVIGTDESNGLLVTNHTYAVLGIDSATQEIALGNPFGGLQTVTYQQLITTNANQYLTATLPSS
jgi:Calpain family cysteine protease